MGTDEKLQWVIDKLSILDGRMYGHEKEVRVKETTQFLGKGFGRVNVYKLQKIIRYEIENGITNHKHSKEILENKVKIHKVNKELNLLDGDFQNKFYIATLDIKTPEIPFSSPFKKIGISDDLVTRMKSQNSTYIINGTRSPYYHKVLKVWTFPTEELAREVETQVINMLSLHRKRVGEWFLDLEDTLIDEVEEILTFYTEKFEYVDFNSYI